jgi:hypothetical protein
VTENALRFTVGHDLIVTGRVAAILAIVRAVLGVLSPCMTPLALSIMVSIVHNSFQLLFLCCIPAWQIPAPDITDICICILSPHFKDINGKQPTRLLFIQPCSLLYIIHTMSRRPTSTTTGMRPPSTTLARTASSASLAMPPPRIPSNPRSASSASASGQEAASGSRASSPKKGRKTVAQSGSLANGNGEINIQVVVRLRYVREIL